MRRFSMFIVLLLSLALLPAMAQKDKSNPSDKTSASASPSAKLDINTASKDQLENLPGIGAAYSQKIIDGRPYKAKNELVTRKIIPKTAYDRVKDQIVAHRASNEKTAVSTSPGKK